MPACRQAWPLPDRTPAPPRACRAAHDTEAQVSDNEKSERNSTDAAVGFPEPSGI